MLENFHHSSAKNIRNVSRMTLKHTLSVTRFEIHLYNEKIHYNGSLTNFLKRLLFLKTSSYTNDLDQKTILNVILN